MNDNEAIIDKGKTCGKFAITRKVPTEWENLYGDGIMGMGDIIYDRYGRMFTSKVFHNMKTWFGKFIRSSN